MSLRLMLASLLAIASVLCLPGCEALEPKTISPFSKKPVTASELAVEAARYDAEQQAADLREQADAERELRRLRSEAGVEARRLANSTDTALVELQSRTETAAQDVVDRVATSQHTRDVEIQAMQRGVDAALQSIQRQQQQRLAAWNAIQSIPGVQAAPGFGAISTLVGGLLAGGGIAGGAVQLTKRRLRRRAEVAEVQLGETEAAAERVIDSIDVLAEIAPEVKAAFAANKSKIDEWQGLAGKALVDRLQRGEKRAA